MKGQPYHMKTVWRKISWLPYYFGFCPNEIAWDKEMKRFNMSPWEPYPDSDGNCAHFTNDGDGHACSIVTLNHKKRSSEAALALLTHEGMHVWRQTLKYIGERKPSSEFEAYAMQHIVCGLVTGYEESGRGKILR